MSEEKGIQGSEKNSEAKGKDQLKEKTQPPEVAESLPETQQPQSQSQDMETHAHHLHKSPGHGWKHYLFEFLMLFLAVFAGFLTENKREHIVEKNRAHQLLQSMLLDVRDNMKHLDSLTVQDRAIIANHDSLVNWLLADSATIDRAAFSRKMGAVWIRNFLVRKETYEQMKSSGSLRYVGNIDFLREMMNYDIATSFAQSRNQDYERKYYTELFIPALYKAYDLACQLNLDTTNHSDKFKMQKVATHHDVLTGNDASVFRHDMGAALTLRLERLRRSLDAYGDAKAACVKMEKLITQRL